MSTRSKLIEDPAPTVDTSLSAQNDQAVRDRAYEIYLARGPEPGDEVNDWLQAESEVLGS